MIELIELIQNQPDNIEARLKLTQQYLSNHDYSQAKDSLNEILGIDPEQVDANYILSQLYEFEENYEEAVLCMEKVVNKQQNPDLIYKLAQLYENIDNYEKALGLYIECYKYSPDDLAICERIANTSQILGNHSQAVEFYNKILKNDPENVVALTQLIDLYEENDSFLFYLSKANLSQIEGLRMPYLHIKKLWRQLKTSKILSKSDISWPCFIAKKKIICRL